MIGTTLDFLFAPHDGHETWGVWFEGLCLVLFVIPFAFWGLGVLFAGVLMVNCGVCGYVCCDRLIWRIAVAYS